MNEDLRIVIYVAIGVVIRFVVDRICHYIYIRKMHKKYIYDPETKCWHEPF